MSQLVFLLFSLNLSCFISVSAVLDYLRDSRARSTLVAEVSLLCYYLRCFPADPLVIYGIRVIVLSNKVAITRSFLKYFKRSIFNQCIFHNNSLVSLSLVVRIICSNMMLHLHELTKIILNFYPLSREKFFPDNLFEFR